MRRIIMIVVIAMMTLNLYAQSETEVCKGGSMGEVINGKVMGNQDLANCLNPKDVQRELLIVDANGNVVFQEEFSGDLLYFNSINLRAGTYVYTVKAGSCSFSDSFVIK